MKRPIEFIILLAKRTFGGADGIAKTGGVITLFAASFKFPALPWQASAGLAVVLLFYGTYGVWKDQKAATLTIQAELDEIKDKTPVYEIKIGEVKQYTAKAIIAKYKAQLEDVEQEVRAKQARANTSGSGLFNAFEGFSMSLPGMMRTETPEEKHDRLQKYVRKLEAYETKISSIYKVELDIRGTRYDENIEVWLTSADVDEMVLDDDYPAKKLPSMPVSDPYGGLLRENLATSTYRPSKLYLSYSDGKDGAYSKISGLNAQRYLRLFEDDFYIRSDTREVKLHVKVSSQSTTPQEFDVLVALDNAPIDELS